MMLKQRFRLKYYSHNRAVQSECDVYMFDDVRIGDLSPEQREWAPSEVRQVVVFSNGAGYQGISVTNSCEHIVSVLFRFHNADPAHTLYIEHYASDPNSKTWGLPEKPSFDLVRFEWRMGVLSFGPNSWDRKQVLRAYRPDWRSGGEGDEGKAFMERLTGVPWIWG